MLVEFVLAKEGLPSAPLEGLKWTIPSFSRSFTIEASFPFTSAQSSLYFWSLSLLRVILSSFSVFFRYAFLLFAELKEQF